MKNHLITVDAIPYQQVPITGHFSVFEMENFHSELSTQPHRHHDFHIIWFTKASGEHIVDFQGYQLSDNVIFTLRPGQVHQLPPTKILGVTIAFTEAFYFSNWQNKETLFDFSTLFDYSQPYGPIKISPQTAESLEMLVRLMRLELAAKSGSSGVIKHYLNSFLLLTEREKKHNMQVEAWQHHDARLIQLRRLIEEYFRKERQVSFYAKYFSLTAKRLNEITRDSINKTVTDMVHDRIILESKRQLSFSHKTVKEICYELGFEDPAYFSRFFRNRTGSSPQEFREAMFK